MSDSINVHGLPVNWRKEADNILANTPHDGSPECVLASSVAFAKRECAAILEAALRQSGEAAEYEVSYVSPLNFGGFCIQITSETKLAIGTKLYTAPPATSGLVEALHGCAKALPVLETMLAVSALHGGAEVTRKLLADVTAALAAVAELIEQRDTLLNALKQALPHVEHAYHTHEDLDGSFWIDVVGCRNAIARVQGVQS